MIFKTNTDYFINAINQLVSLGQMQTKPYLLKHEARETSRSPPYSGFTLKLQVPDHV
jgi:hypothetical protein